MMKLEVISLHLHFLTLSSPAKYLILAVKPLWLKSPTMGSAQCAMISAWCEAMTLQRRAGTHYTFSVVTVIWIRAVCICRAEREKERNRERSREIISIALG